MLELKYVDPVSEQIVGIGNLCKRWRILNNYTVHEVAEETGYSFDNIVKFEQGKNNNLRIFIWYLERGFDVKKFEKAGVDNDN